MTPPSRCRCADELGELRQFRNLRFGTVHGVERGVAVRTLDRAETGRAARQGQRENAKQQTAASSGTRKRRQVAHVCKARILRPRTAR